MYGPNVEKMISQLSLLETAVYNSSKQLMTASDSSSNNGSRPKMISHWHEWPSTTTSTDSAGAGDEDHTHPISIAVKTTTEKTDENDTIYEAANDNMSASSIISSIQSSLTSLQTEIANVKSIEGKLYVNKDLMHNSSGSPYTELYAIQDTFTDMGAFANSHASLSYIGDKVNMWMYMQSMLSRISSAKFAVIMYADNLQRGYDQVFNGGKPSIKFNTFPEAGGVI